jgi:uncharacterized protein YceH (UPF0502 family)
MSVAEPITNKPAPRWQPLAAIDRRVLGVLAEKAKTTPDVYPMSVNAICTGANQKNNRHPLMQLQPDDVEASLERLRGVGAVAEVQGGGRVLKYRHYLYDWLGVDKVELAVMIELLLRGAQTVGELRGRAARMEPIADLAALKPVLDSLRAKGLVLALSPEGRGQVVSHALYQPQELEKIRREVVHAAPVEAQHESTEPARPHFMAASAAPPMPAPSALSSPSSAGEVSALRSELAAAQRRLEELTAEVRQLRDEFERFRASVGG